MQQQFGSSLTSILTSFTWHSSRLTGRWRGGLDYGRETDHSVTFKLLSGPIASINPYSSLSFLVFQIGSLHHGLGCVSVLFSTVIAVSFIKQFDVFHVVKMCFLYICVLVLSQYLVEIVIICLLKSANSFLYHI